VNHGGNILISCSDDGYFKIWDRRISQSTLSFKSGEDSLCVGQFNHINEFLFAVAGDSSGEIAIWDQRMP
jgi:WD40 repeat protein